MSALASRVASARLDEDQRRALDLRERGARYADIASELGVAPRDVAELLVGARLSLREAVRDRPLPAVATDDCRRARPLLCARQDGETLAREDAEFVRAHVDGCESCRGARIALREGALALRAALEAAPDAFAPARPSPPVRERPAPVSVPAPAPPAPAAAAPAPPVVATAAPAPAAAAPAEPAPSPPARERPARRERPRRARRVPAVVAVTVLAAFVATMTTIFVGGDDPATSSATGRPEATAEPSRTPSPSRGTATVDTEAAQRRAAARRRARARRERAERRRRAAASAAATATPVPTATAAPEATAPEPQATPKPERKRKPRPQQEPADDGTETRPGEGGAVIPQQTDPNNPDGKPDVIPDFCTEDNPDCESG